MPASPIISGLMLFFSLTTVAVIVYPIVKVLPSRLEKRTYRKIALHSEALAGLAAAMSANAANAEQHARLSASYAYHKAMLLTLKPDAVLPMPESAGWTAATA